MIADHNSIGGYIISSIKQMRPLAHEPVHVLRGDGLVEHVVERELVHLGVLGEVHLLFYLVHLVAEEWVDRRWWDGDDDDAVHVCWTN